MVPRPTREVDIDKQAWRAALLSRRARIGARERADTAAALVAALRPLSGGGPVAAYASVGTEPDTGPLLAVLPEVLLPVLLPDGDLDWVRWEGELVPGPCGLRQPPGPRLGRDAVADCAVVLVPALAVDAEGTRLGRGGGSYDRALARAAGLTVAALHAGELVARLPREAHDRPVGAAVLPGQGLVPLPAPDPATMPA